MAKPHHRRTRVVIVGLLTVAIGCQSAPHAKGRQTDPANEADRLESLLTRKKIDKDKVYATSIEILELRAQAKKDLQPDIRGYQALITKYPDRPEATLSLARALLANQEMHGRWYTYQLGGIVDILGRFQKQHPENNEYDYRRLQMARILRYRHGAYDSLLRMKKVKTDDPRIKLELAEWGILEGEYPESLQWLKEAQAGIPASPTIHYLLGVLAGREGNADESLRQYELALSINPKHVDSIAGRLLLRWARQENIGTERRTLASVSPYHPALNFLTGLEKVRARQAYGLEWIGKAVKADPQNRLYRDMYDRVAREQNEELERFLAGGTAVVGFIIFGGAIINGANTPAGSRPGGSSTDTWNEMRRQEQSQADERERRRQEYLRFNQMDRERQQRELLDYRRQRGY